MTRSALKENTTSNNGIPPSSAPLNTLEDASSTTRLGEGDSTSDNDAGERPVREKLKKTSIAGLPKYHIAAEEEGVDQVEDELMASQESPSSKEPAELSGANSDDGRGRPTKKRSFEDLQTLGDSDKPSAVGRPEQTDNGHKRKKSRDVQAGDSVKEIERSTANPKALDEAEEEPQGDSVKDASGGVENGIESRTKNLHATLSESHPMDEDASEDLLSPKKKRSRDQVDKDDEKPDDGSEQSNDSEQRSGSEGLEGEDQTSRTMNRNAKGEPEKKRHRDTSKGKNGGSETDSAPPKVPPTSGFANTSAVSPFGALASSKPTTSQTRFKDETSGEPKVTSSSTFASSGLAAFAGSDKSPFGTLGASSTASTSGFGALAAGKTEETRATGFGGLSGSVSTFGGVSPFATAGTSGFNRPSGSVFSSDFGGGFGTRAKSGGLTSFAAPGGPSVLRANSKTAKVFGAPGEAEKEGDDGDDSGASEDDDDENKEDDRFFEQEMETGEEAEDTIFTCKAKLFNFDSKEWKERGLGTFKVNVTELCGDDGEQIRKTARLIMRTEGTGRLVLNTTVFKDMKVGDNAGKEPIGKMVNLAAVENGKPVPMLLKTGNVESAKDLYHKILDLQEEL